MTTKKKTYTQSEAVKQAQAALQAQLSQKPGAYQSQWQDSLSTLLEEVLNREDFSYDLGSDPLYRQYRDLYVRQGRLAMEDTLGQAQAMTGGYGNSYAQTAGQQAYGSYLQNLNARVPELYQLALERYRQQGSALNDRLALLTQQEDRDYGRYQDALAQWADQRDYLAGQYDAQSREDYDRFTQDRDYALRQELAAQEQQRWQAEFDQAALQWQLEQAQDTGGSGGSRGSGGYAGNGGVDAATVRRAQAFVGASADGMWGKKSQAAAKAKGYGSLQEVIQAMEGSGKGSAAAPDNASDFASAQEIAGMVKRGKSQYEINARIAALTAQGKLSPAKAAKLRQLYIDRKYYV